MAPASHLLYALAATLACQTTVATISSSASGVPSTSAPSATSNPNGVYNNPYDSTSAPVTYPGQPTASDALPPSTRPTPAYSSGGLPEFAKNYIKPAWIPVHHNKTLHGAVSSFSTASAAPSSNHKRALADPYINVVAHPTHTVTAGETPTAGPCGPPPNTGATRTYTFNVAYATISPDGVTKNGLVINNQFPGPLIEANWGDWIQVTVNNLLPNEGTTIHWHGLLQTQTPWFDGVPAVSQCPIAPNGTFTYLFRADQYGTSWYHSHYSAQLAGGAVGPIVIHGPKTASYDVDLGPVLLADWYHQDYYTLVNNTMNFNIPQSNNNLINGKMNYPCQNTTLPCTPNAGISKFAFNYGTKYRIRLINAGAEGLQKFSIDSHKMTVIAVDFTPIVPYTTNVVTLGVGQRADVIVQSKSLLSILLSTNKYWMRSNLGGCSFTDGVSPLAVAGVYYPFANTNNAPSTTSDVTAAQLGACQNDDLSLTQAWCPSKPDPNPPTTDTVTITFGNNGTNFVWFMNGSSFHADYNAPVMLDAAAGNFTFAPNWNVANFGSNSSIRLVLINTFPVGGAHPMHLHGHNFHVLAQGNGTWDGTVTNPGNTLMRDVQLLPMAVDFVPATFSSTPSYIVLQWQNDNPSIWPLHCHIAWHVSAGLYMNSLERPADLMKRNIPQASTNLCAAWQAFSNSTVVDEIDSGV